jgi:hypothetical protein
MNGFIKIILYLYYTFLRKFDNSLRNKRSKDGPYYVDEIVPEMAMFLIDDSNASRKTPFKVLLQSNKLDYSYKSLYVVENYLNKIKKDLPKLNNAERSLISLRVGTYCGEVIRRNSSSKLIWLKYSDKAKKHKILQDLGESYITHYFLFDEDNESVVLPTLQVNKFIEFGINESLYTYSLNISKHPNELTKSS